jgi:protocatechuate 3,4-dioxygenase alpha subunit
VPLPRVRSVEAIIFKQTPSQTVGPYFAYGLVGTQYGYDLQSVFGPELTRRSDTPRHHIRIVGRVLDGAGRPIDYALVAIVHARQMGAGSRRLTRLRQLAFAASDGWEPAPWLTIASTSAPSSRVDRGRGRAIRPRNPDDGEMLDHAFTRIYFDDLPSNDQDRVLAPVPAERRSTLLARREDECGGVSIVWTS